NGAGKTTLLRIMMGLEPPDAGAVTIGPNTRFAYVDQARAALDPDRTVYEEVAGDLDFVRVGEETISVRAYLTRFLFAGAKQEEMAKRPEGRADTRPARPLSAKEKRELDDMERAIEAAEADAARLSRLLEDPALYADAARREDARALAAELESARARVAGLFA